MSIHIEDIDKQVVRSYYTSPKIEESIERLLKADEELMHSETLPGYKVDFVEEESCKDVEMRDATPEERESVDKYIKSISTTGVNFCDLESYEYIQKEKSLSYLDGCMSGLKALDFIQEYKKTSCEDGREKVLDKIIAEIETQEKWLAQSGYNAYNVDIAFNSIKLVLAETENGK